jgi:hypothetical protein
VLVNGSEESIERRRPSCRTSCVPGCGGCFASSAVFASTNVCRLARTAAAVSSKLRVDA